MMKAMGIEKFGGLEQVKELRVSMPEPYSPEVLVKVAYAGVNPVDWKIVDGYLQGRLPHKFPVVLGWDVAGTVARIGSDVTNLNVGDEVFAYARTSVIHHGTFAEYINLDSHVVVKKPITLSFAQAAAIPLTALTAWQSLIDACHLQKNQTVLIHAGAGGVGGIAIQIASRYIKAKVMTTASAKNHAYVKELGAHYVIDYTQEDFRDAVRKIAPNGVDVVFDCVGGETLEKSYELVASNGHIISICAKCDLGKTEKLGIHGHYVFVKPDGHELQQIAHLLDQKIFAPPPIEEFSFSKVREALEKVKSGHVRGKIVLKVI